MELIIIVSTLLSLFFSALQPAACSSLQVHSQSSFQHEKAVLNAHQKLSVPILPRKLGFTGKVIKADEARDLVLHKQKKSLPEGKQHKEKQKVVGTRGTRQEWMEEDEASEYFTMDYNRVRRRRPIHNKQLPVGP